MPKNIVLNALKGSWVKGQLPNDHMLLHAGAPPLDSATPYS